MAADRILRFFREKTAARVVTIAVFLGLLFLFRHQWATLVFFVSFERFFGFSGKKLAKIVGIPKGRGVLLAVLLTFAVIGAMIGFGVGGTVHSLKRLQADWPIWSEELKHHPLYARYHEYVDDQDELFNHVKGYAGQALGVAGAIGRFFVQAMVGFVLAIVFLLEEDKLEVFVEQMKEDTFFGRLIRWITHLVDAVSVTVQLQLIVAAFNTVTTLPILFFLGIPHKLPLMILVFISALVPVIGNLVAGSILGFLAFQAKRWVGVGIFAGLTFLLHKVESYYLNPRLTARHVKVPGFVLIVSLIAFEHVFGFAGLFLSFPFLFVAGRIRQEFLAEERGQDPDDLFVAPPTDEPPPVA
jgi:predicted PurR-regulated permease PerM